MTFVLATFALVFGDYLEIENTLQIDYLDVKMRLHRIKDIKKSSRTSQRCSEFLNQPEKVLNTRKDNYIFRGNLLEHDWFLEV